MLADPSFPAFLLDFPIFYLVYNQNGMKQLNSIKIYYWDEDLNTWDLDDGINLQNTFDANGKITKMIFGDEEYHFNWSCK
jgi:hypothetical protein